MTSKTKSLLAVLMVAALGASGPAPPSVTISKMNPFSTVSDAAKEVATEGDRISILSADQKLEPAEALKGVDFALPPMGATADWPLPGETPEQATGNSNAAPGLAIAWRKGIGMASKEGQQLITPPVAAGGRVFTMDAQASVSAHDARTGAADLAHQHACRGRQQA